MSRFIVSTFVNGFTLAVKLQAFPSTRHEGRQRDLKGAKRVIKLSTDSGSYFMFHSHRINFSILGSAYAPLDIKPVSFPSLNYINYLT